MLQVLMRQAEVCVGCRAADEEESGGNRGQWMNTVHMAACQRRLGRGLRFQGDARKGEKCVQLMEKWDAMADI